MSIQRALEIHCDRVICSFSERLDTPTMYVEWPALRKAGWTRSHGEHFCPACSKAVKEKKP